MCLIYLPPEKQTKKPDETSGNARLYCVWKKTAKELDKALTLTGQGLELPELRETNGFR
ncbi:hypothetical protein [Cytobacillus horneckiae]|uniref:hypothetical protein n=1 Tax=Cytobacillus horneckiae TaxID=549687 RepID=UPI003D26243E